MKHTRFLFIYRVAILSAMVGMFCMPLHSSAAAFKYDASVQTGSITFSPAQFYAGEPVRIYGVVGNQGTEDIQGYIAFYQGPTMIGDPQPFSMKKFGAPEEFWVDWTPDVGTYNVAVRVIMTTPVDENTANNTAVSSLMTITNRPTPPPPAPAPTPSPTSSAQSSTTGGATKPSPVPTPSTGSPIVSTPTPSPSPAPVPAQKPGLFARIFHTSQPQQEVKNEEPAKTETIAEKDGTTLAPEPVKTEDPTPPVKKPETKKESQSGKGMTVGKAIGGGLVIAGLFLLGALYFTKKSKEAADDDTNIFS